MKSNRIFLLALASLSLAACSNNDKFNFGDDDLKWNTNGGVTVSMEESSVEVIENQGLFTIPVKVTGEPNGYVQVTVELEETGANPAMANVHYYLTNDIININPEDKVGYLEIATVDFRGLDPNRTFNIRITGARGAEIGGNTTTLVTIDEKGSSPLYNELAGPWIMMGNSLGDDGELSAEYIWPVTLVCNDPDGRLVTVNGGEIGLELLYDYDTEEGYGEMVLNAGTDAGMYGPYNLFWSNGAGATSGPLANGVWNGTYTSATFGTADSEFYIMAAKDGSVAGYLDVLGAFTLSRLKN